MILIPVYATGNSRPVCSAKHKRFIAETLWLFCYYYLMTLAEIVAKVKTLDLPENSYIVFGSCPLAAVGLREANDVDMLVDEVVFKDLRRRGWQILQKGPKDNPLVYDVFEAHPNWDFSQYKPTLKHLLATADIIEGVPFASLAEVRK